MTITEIIELIATNGAALFIIAYFLFKDYKFTTQLIDLMYEIKEYFAIMRNEGDNK